MKNGGEPTSITGCSRSSSKLPRRVKSLLLLLVLVVRLLLCIVHCFSPLRARPTAPMSSTTLRPKRSRRQEMLLPQLESLRESLLRLVAELAFLWPVLAKYCPISASAGSACGPLRSRPPRSTASNHTSFYRCSSDSFLLQLAGGIHQMSPSRSITLG